MSKEVGNVRYLALDVFRGIAALGVALFHFRWIDPALQANMVMTGLVMLVDFFFVLSGFVLAHAYFGRDLGILEFVQVRLARLYPLHLFALLMFVVLQAVKLMFAGAGGDLRNQAFAGMNAWNFADTLMLLQSTGLLWDQISWNYPSWSISTELFANVIVFVLIVVLGRGQLDTICSVLLGSIVTFFLVAGVQAHDYGPLALLRCVAAFCLGCLVHSLYQRTRRTYRARSALVTFLVATGLECLALGALLLGILSESLTGLWLVSALCFGIVIYVFAFEAGGFSLLIERTGLQWLGGISYSIYLNHVFIGSLVSAAYVPLAARLGFTGAGKIAVFFAFFVPPLLLYSWLTHRLVELPAQRYFAAWGGMRVRKKRIHQ